MPKRNGQSNAISWANERSDSTAETLIAALNEDCRTNLQGVPAEMVRAVHTRALQNVYEIVTSHCGDLAQNTVDQDGFTYGVPAGRPSGQGDNGGKRNVTRRKRRTKASPKTESSTNPESDAPSEETPPTSEEAPGRGAHSFV